MNETQTTATPGAVNDSIYGVSVFIGDILRHLSVRRPSANEVFNLCLLNASMASDNFFTVIDELERLRDRLAASEASRAELVGALEDAQSAMALAEAEWLLEPGASRNGPAPLWIRSLRAALANARKAEGGEG